LGKNIGYEIDGVFGTKSAGDFAEKQKRAWEFVKSAIDQGLPCYGWELDIPEFYVVYGYDDAGYYFSGPGCDEGKGPKPWQELGDTEIGVSAVNSVGNTQGGRLHKWRNKNGRYDRLLRLQLSPVRCAL